MLNIKNPLQLAVLIFALTFFISGNIVFGQEHPKKEHPGGAKTEITADEISHAIENYIKKESAKKDGHFVVYDSVQSKPIELTLEKIHKDKICMVQEDMCFACADFKSTDGHKYDLDFFVYHPSKTDVTVNEVIIHKQDGKARYGWVEDSGMWKRK